MSDSFDPRTTPARPDVAAKHLEGRVQAARFVEGAAKQVAVASAALRRRPAPDAMQETQLLFGETFTLYDEADGWAWGQAALDDYVGYVEARALAAPAIGPTHRVCSLRTYVFPKPDLKTAPLMLLSMNARVTETGREDRFSAIARGGYVFTADLAPLAARAPDWVAEAEKFLGAPYLWGGRESLGLDCSGLIQTALRAAGVESPRDTDMMERALGAALPTTDDLSNLRRGDLVFWPGHVGVMLDGARMLHANAHHMRTEIEPLSEARARIQAAVGPIRTIKRL
jgi:cell wall-associated NlpC family hydrolase